jgi:23S rRNA (guanosine2251-2'-O)-methyltransferase
MENLIFGIRPVIEAIEAGRQIEKIYIKKEAEGVLLGELREIARTQRINVQEVPVEKLDRLTRGKGLRDERGPRGGHGGRSGVNHQGVVAQISAIVYADLEEILAAVPEGAPGLVVVFDGVTDVRNFGGIARSAECAGAHGLIVPMKNAAPVNADALKASAGALNIIPVARVGSIRNTLKLLQSEGFQVVAASEKAPKVLYEADFTCPTALVMGSEDEGISKEVLKLCNEQVAIPLRGRIESLNVSAAAAVMLFEVVRQRTVTK